MAVSQTEGSDTNEIEKGLRYQEENAKNATEPQVKARIAVFKLFRAWSEDDLESLKAACQLRGLSHGTNNEHDLRGYLIHYDAHKWTQKFSAAKLDMEEDPKGTVYEEQVKALATLLRLLRLEQKKTTLYYMQDQLESCYEYWEAHGALADPSIARTRDEEVKEIISRLGKLQKVLEERKEQEEAWVAEQLENMKLKTKWAGCAI